MYKLEFPLDDFKKTNSLLSEYYTEYFYRDGHVYGASINDWSFHIGMINKEMGKWIENLLIPPNHVRSVVADCKKTMTYIKSTPADFDIYIFKDKIKDEPELSKGVNVFSLRREIRAIDTPAARHMNLIEDNSKHFLDILNSRYKFREINLDEFIRPFMEEAPCHIIDEDSGDMVILTREMFPKYQKIMDLAWESFNIDDDYSWAIFRVTYDCATIFTFVKYIRGMA